MGGFYLILHYINERFIQLDHRFEEQFKDMIFKSDPINGLEKGATRSFRYLDISDCAYSMNASNSCQTKSIEHQS